MFWKAVSSKMSRDSVVMWWLVNASSRYSLPCSGCCGAKLSVRQHDHGNTGSSYLLTRSKHDWKLNGACERLQPSTGTAAEMLA